ncbi:AmmeMemoRadiSam system radical SAM enzyme [Seleniivibrio woodruffii]|uniref:AmmeMemoRadiSam system radical SAM enzyme n=1 Tax=Seleniivibrio woodruffii TaxID=1078050 RepID=UPI0039E4B02F
MKARYWQAEDNQCVRCVLCPHTCMIENGRSGKCLIRKNIGGVLTASAYGRVASAAVDPIEKKPLYHFHPASNILSIGFNGCNMSCLFCQNWQISTRETATQEASPQRLIETALDAKSIGIAYTYNEPLTNFEFVMDCAKAFRQAGLKNVIVSNGMINPEPVRELIPFLDAANIDLKGFTEEFYQEHGGRLKTVKHTIEALFRGGVHLEVTNLLIPEKNGREEDFERMCSFLANISPEIPLHISGYFPQYKYDFPPTPNNTLTEYAKKAKKYLNFIYIGNRGDCGFTDTVCAGCGHTLIRRSGYETCCLTDKNTCPACLRKFYAVF